MPVIKCVYLLITNALVHWTMYKNIEELFECIVRKERHPHSRDRDCCQRLTHSFPSGSSGYFPFFAKYVASYDLIEDHRLLDAFTSPFEPLILISFSGSSIVFSWNSMLAKFTRVTLRLHLHAPTLALYLLLFISQKYSPVMLWLRNEDLSALRGLKVGITVRNLK